MKGRILKVTIAVSRDALTKNQFGGQVLGFNNYSALFALHRPETNHRMPQSGSCKGPGICFMWTFGNCFQEQGDSN